MGFCAVHSEWDYTFRTQLSLRDKIKTFRRLRVVFPKLSKTGKEWGSRSWSEEKKSKPKGGPAPCSRSLLHEVHVTVPLQEFKIAHPVKIILGAQFHFRVLDDLG